MIPFPLWRLFQVKMEQEQQQTEIRDLQDQLSEMHDELDNAKHAEDGEREMLLGVSRQGGRMRPGGGAVVLFGRRGRNQQPLW